MAKAVTRYVFRNGPIEDMHANGQLSQSDMKRLNKYMVNRLAGHFTAAANNQWMHLYAALVPTANMYGRNWDAAEPDTEEMEKLYERFIENSFSL